MPVIFVGIPSEWVAQADGHAGSPLPWGGDFSAARSVSIRAPNIESGLHQFQQVTTRSVGGEPVRDAGDGPHQNFAVDPSFLSYTSVPIRITVVVRRKGPSNAGFNLKYESTTGWKGTGAWFTIPAGDQWTTKEFVITDDEFVGKWGYHFMMDSDSAAFAQYSVRSVTVTKL
jgi:hypothetical protein